MRNPAELARVLTPAQLARLDRHARRRGDAYALDLVVVCEGCGSGVAVPCKRAPGIVCFGRRLRRLLSGLRVAPAPD